MKYALMIFFILVAFLGLGHGFPVVHLFKDEMYYAPLVAMQQRSLLPTDLPYGTVTFYGTYLLQVVVLLPLYVRTGFDELALGSLIMNNPHLAYLAPRVLNAILFLSMILVAMKAVKVGSPRQANYAPWIILILFSNIVLLTFAHSGKMWLASVVFFFLSGIFIATSARKAVFFASLAFANFQLMAIFWVLSLAHSILRKGMNRAKAYPLLLISIPVPSLFFALNPGTIRRGYLIVRTPMQFAEHSAFNLPEASVSLDLGEFASLYLVTFASYLEKIVITAPIVLSLGVLALVTRAQVKNKVMLSYGATSLVVYLIFISGMFFSRGLYDYYRYLLPIQIALALIFLSIELPKTRLNSLAIPCLALISAYAATISTVNLVLPTTYNDAYDRLVERHSDPNDVIISRVTEITFPYNYRSAELAKKYVPKLCGHRCEYALAHRLDTEFQGNYLEVKEREVDLVRQSLSHMNIVDVLYDPDHRDYRQVERGVGSYFIREAWVPSQLGRRVLIQGTAPEGSARPD